MRSGITLSCLALCALAALLPAQTPVLVKDLNPGAADAFDEFNYKGAQLGDKYLLPATGASGGQELYVLENNQLTLLKDINPGAAGSNPTYFTVLGNKVYFTADDGAHGAELWVSDGTAAGTQLAVDVSPGATGSDPTGLIADASGRLYFSSNTLCFVTDGVSAGVAAGPAGVDFSDNYNYASNRVCRYQDGIAFVVKTGQAVELWKATGATATKLFTMTTNSFFTQAYGLIPVAAGLIFGVYDSFDPNLNGLYSFSAATGTAPRLTAPGTGITRILPLSADKAVVMSGTGMYATDGTAAGTVLLSAEIPGLYQGQTLPYAVHDGKMLFWGADASFSMKIKLTDGTPAGTTVANTTQVPFLSPIAHYFEHAWYAVGISNGFTAEIWYTNLKTGLSTKRYTYPTGSASGPAVLPLTLIGNNLYLISNIGGGGRELYRMTVSQTTGLDETTAPSAPYALQAGAAPGTYRIVAEETAELLDLRIFSLDGRLVSRRAVWTGAEFDLPDAGGVYVLEVVGARGRASFRAVRP